ncbi:MAG: peptidoglycan-associated lipoprotein Pal [Candidatus Methylomirabilales bacterium]
MKRRRVRLNSATILLGALLILFGCAKKSEVQTAGTGVRGPGATPRPEGKVEEEKIPPPVSIREVPVTPRVAERSEPALGSAVAEDFPLKDVFFDFRESALREDAKDTLKNNIQWLKANPNIRIVVEGHCDERGTNEYNLALGERRAKAVRDFLLAGGIDVRRISIISYGEERPFVLGHDESAWQWNRRGHIGVVSQ